LFQNRRSAASLEKPVSAEFALIQNPEKTIQVSIERYIPKTESRWKLITKAHNDIVLNKNWQDGTTGIGQCLLPIKKENVFTERRQRSTVISSNNSLPHA